MTGPDRVAASLERIADILERQTATIKNLEGAVSKLETAVARLEVAVVTLSGDTKQIRDTLFDAAKRGHLRVLNGPGR